MSTKEPLALVPLPPSIEDQAIAVARNELEPVMLSRVIGTAWEGAASRDEVHLVNVAVGVCQVNAIADLVERSLGSRDRTIAMLLDRLESLESRLAEME